MKRNVFATACLMLVLGFMLNPAPSHAQNELLRAGETGGSFWTGKARAGQGEFSGTGFGIGINDVLEFGVQQIDDPTALNDQVFTIGLHIPSYQQERPIGAAVFMVLSDATGIGAEVYGRFELSRKFTLVPAMSITLYPNVVSRLNGKQSANVSSFGFIFGYEFMEGALLTVTPGYSTWWDSGVPDTKAVTVGVLIYTKEW